MVERVDQNSASRGAGNARYRMRQNLVSFGDDFWIENEQGEKMFEVNGKALRMRKTLIFRDVTGKELCTIQERMIDIRKTMSIEGPDGRILATVTRAMLRLLRDHFTVNITGGPDIEIQGSVIDHEYEFEQGGHKIARISKQWFHFADSYGVEIESGENDMLILAATVAVDMIAHPAR